MQIILLGIKRRLTCWFSMAFALSTSHPCSISPSLTVSWFVIGRSTIEKIKNTNFKFILVIK